LKKTMALISAILIMFSVFAFGTFIVSAEVEQVTGQEMTFAFGDAERTGIYTGQIKDGLAHGQGRFEWKNSDGDAFVHEGEFIGGAITGNGTRTLNGNECVWEGTFLNGLLNGKGKAIYDGAGRQEGVWVNGELFNGKYYTDLGVLKYEYINGERITAKSFNIYLALLIGIVVLCLIVGFALPFRIVTSRITSSKLLYSPKLVAKEKPDLINKIIAVTDIFKGILCLYSDRIEYVTKKNVTVFMFSEIFTVRHQHKNVMALILYSGEKHGIIVKPEEKKDEWIEMINNQIKWYRQSFPEDPNSAETLHKESIVNIFPTAALGRRNGTLFLYKDRIEFTFIIVRPMNPFTRNHLDKIRYDRKKEPITIPLSQIRYAVKGFGENAILGRLQIETYTNQLYSIVMAPPNVVDEWVVLIHKQMGR